MVKIRKYLKWKRDSLKYWNLSIAIVIIIVVPMAVLTKGNLIITKNVRIKLKLTKYSKFYYSKF